VDSPLAYIGGKSKLSKTIIEMIPDHKMYCEAFAGAAWVFFRKEPSHFESINDLDSDLVCFYRVLQNHLEEFLKQFKWVLSSREWFEDWKRQQVAGGLTDIQRAARYYYIQRHAFSGNVRNRNFAATPLHRPRVNLIRLEEELSEVHLRLSQVTIENLPYQTFLERYDRPGVFFYLDPPYWRAPWYKFNMELPDFQDMSERLGKIKAKFILSINDTPEIRKIFNKFQIKPVTTIYTSNDKGKHREGKELLVSNF
jgi:DNA adenine methylase